MSRPTLRQVIDHVRLIERRAKGQEPGDDALSRLQLDHLAAAPSRWLRETIAKLAFVAVLAVLLAGLFAGGAALMRVIGFDH